MDYARLKERFLHAIKALLVFAYFYIIGRQPYFVIWITKRSFFYLWFLVAVLIIINQKILAKWIMIGCFGGIPIADIAEKAVRLYFEGTDMFNRVFLGVPCWFLFFGLCFVIGGIKQYKSKKCEDIKSICENY